MDIITKIIALILPWKNESTAQKVGTVLTILSILIGVALQFLPPVPPPVPGPVPSPDVIVPLDIPAPQNPVPDTFAVPDVQPDVPGTESVSTVILGVLGTVVTSPFGCSAAQVAGWQAFGVGVSDCLVNKCQLAADVVAGMQSGAWGELLSDNLPCALVCLGSAVGDVIVKRGEVKQVSTWFGTANEVRVVEVYRVRVQRAPYN